MLEALVALLVAPRCAACGAGTAAGQRICAGCRADMPWLRDTCPRCALPRPCGPPCPAARAAFAAAWSPLAFEGPARSLVHALKFRGRTALAPALAAQMAANAPPGLLRGVQALVAVPTHPARRRARGFDHARLLAGALGERLDLAALDALSHRGEAGATQVGKGRAQRRRSDSRFAPRAAVPAVVGLVDDVHTTGATLDACARQLTVAGATRVIGLTYARALG